MSRDVVFKEDIFLFTQTTSSCPPLFPVFQFTESYIESTPVPPIATPPSSPCPTSIVSDSPSSPASASDMSAAVPLRRSSRNPKPPIWFHDYVTTQPKSTCLYPLSNHVNYHHLSPLYGLALVAYSSISEPKSFHEAALNPLWVAAMQVEIKALEENHIWSITDLPPDKHSIGCKWVFKVKYLASGAVERYKARLVAKGFNQKEGLDYSETFSLVAKMVTVRSVLVVASAKHWLVFQMDVHNAFLQGDLFEAVYMVVPPSFCRQGESGKVCKLHKSLYGLKQAPRQWNLKLTEALLQLGFVQSHYDYSRFTRSENKELMTF